MNRLVALFCRVRFRVVTWLSTRPALYFGARKLVGRLDNQCLKPDTDIVIEGFPRSANSTTVHRFLERQHCPVRVAHHKHHAAQILRGVSWRRPVVVLIREPRGACLSLLALAAEARQRANRSATSELTFGDALNAYIAFYESVEKQRHWIVIARFEHVRRDVDELVRRVNERFGTTFHAEPIAMTPQPELGWHAMPNQLRDGIKETLSARFDAALSRSPRLRRTFRRANAVHARYCEADERAR